MNENINLCEILKDCPKGTKLYSPLFGEVEFFDIDENEDMPIWVDFNDNMPITLRFKKDGKYYPNGECLLFPSKDQRDWSKWKCPKPKFDPKTLQPFDKVLVRNFNDREWFTLLFSHINTKGMVIVAGFSCTQVIPYNEETKHLVGTSDEAPEYYRYWED